MPPLTSEPVGQQSTLPEVSVLLSIFNGEEFIQEQLDSLLAQEGVRIRLIFHMDEEDPATEAKVREAYPDAQRITVSPEQGLPRAFFELILAAPLTDFYAFCDQDDVWHPRKLKAAVEALAERPDSPVLWICRVQPFRGSTPKDYNGLPYPSYVAKPSFGNALVETIGPGCAMVWTKEFHKFLMRGQVAEGALMHDSWTYLVAAGLGVVVVEPAPMVLYRLHPRNAVGIRNGLRQRLLRFRRANERGSPSLYTQAAALLSHFGTELRETDRCTAEVLARGRWINRIQLVFTNRLTRQAFWERGLLAIRLAID